MGTPEVLIFLCLLSSVVYGSHDCITSFCGKSNIPVRFPFRLEDRTLPQSCGYPGFNFRCSAEGVPVLDLPYSREFFVRDVNYLTQEIQLYDPENCIPWRLLDLNLSSSPFRAVLLKNYTFLSCPTDFVTSRFTTIDCLSNSSMSVLATASSSFVKAMNMCRIIDDFAIPVSWQTDRENDFSSALDGDLQLTWGEPNCVDCEASGGFCGFEDGRSQKLSCFDASGRGKPRGMQIFRIIALSIVIPAITCSMALSCFMCLLDRRRDRSLGTNAQNVATATIAPQAGTVPEGLDVRTIESYKKVVLGESRRVPGPNDVTCPICLAEYHPKETLRCLPDCEHCFHADCIDEWLRMNGTCPVCRSSPPPASVNA